MSTPKQQIPANLRPDSVNLWGNYFLALAENPDAADPGESYFFAIFDYKHMPPVREVIESPSQTYGAALVVGYAHDRNHATRQLSQLVGFPSRPDEL